MLQTVNKYIIVVFCVLFSLNVKAEGRSEVILSIGKNRYYIHTVEAGNTLYSLAKEYQVSEQQIINDNPYIKGGLQLEQVIKILYSPEPKKLYSKRKQDKIFNTHIMAYGETLYSICKMYGIEFNQVMSDNPGIDPTALSVGTEINIRRTAVGDQSSDQINTQMQEYVDVANKATDNYILHTVQADETLHSLSDSYNTPYSEISQLNMIEQGLVQGQMLRIPRAELKMEHLNADDFTGDYKYLADSTIKVAMMLPFCTPSPTRI